VTPRSSGTAISPSSTKAGNPATTQLVERRAKQRGAVVAVAADEPQFVTTDDRQEPVPVMLDLMQPASPSGGWALGATICSGTR
jgi:hypothetical protein